MLRRANIVILGHVDHGKSTLIGRLLYDSGSIADEKIEEVKKTAKNLGKGMEFAFFIDNFKEERERAMTIDIIPTPFKIKNRDYLLIDCPGHKEFIKNMLSGASQADSAILVVSAKIDEGIQEQTKRHLFLAKMLGIKQVFVVINKMDDVDYDKKRFDELKDALDKLLSKFSFDKEKIFFIPTSAKFGENLLTKSGKMKWYKEECFIDLLDKNILLPKDLTNKPFRGLVQDVYEIYSGKVIILKIESGNIGVGDEIIFNLCKEKGKVKDIKIFGEERSRAEAGESVGIETVGVDIAKIKRGDVASRDKLSKKDTLNSMIFLFSDKEIKEGDAMEIECGTAEKRCILQKVTRKIDPSLNKGIDKEKNKIKPTEVGVVVLKIFEPIIAENFSDMPPLGRFLLVKDKDMVAVGVVSEDR